MKRLFLMVAMVSMAFIFTTHEAKAQNPGWAAYKAKLQGYQNPRVFFAAVIPGYGLYCFIRCQIDWKFTMKPATDRYGNLIEYYEVTEVPVVLLKTTHIDGSAMTLEEFESNVQ